LTPLERDEPRCLYVATARRAVPTPPLFALAGQLDRTLKYMVDLNWAPLVGAAVVHKKSWDRIPQATREAMLKIAADIGKKVKADGRAENVAAVGAMTKRGLHVQPVTPEAQAEWIRVIDGAKDQIRGKIVPPEMYDEAQKLLKEYRAQSGSQSK
jgi:TRAP-type C4-dicarboxylate transport system substrate-binding protein